MIYFQVNLTLSGKSNPNNHSVKTISRKPYEKKQESNNQHSQKAEQQARELATKSQILDQLKNEFFQFKTQNQQKKPAQETVSQQKIQQITNLTAQLDQLREQFDQICSQTILKSLNNEGHWKFHDSQVVCTLEEKDNIRKFFTKTIKQVKFLFRASDHGFCVKKFHEKCDSIPNTLTVVRTEFDKKI